MLDRTRTRSRTSQASVAGIRVEHAALKFDPRSFSVLKAVLWWAVLLLVCVLPTPGHSEPATSLQALEAELASHPVEAERLLAEAKGQPWLDSFSSQLLLARAYYQRNDFRAAMQLLAVEEAKLDRSAEPRLLARLRILAAQNLYRLGSQDQAMQAAREAQQLLMAGQDPEWWGHSHNVIGAIHLAADKYAEAIDSFSQALRLFEAIGMQAEIAKLHTNLGAALIESQRLDEAWPHLQQALKLAERLGRHSTRITALVNLSELEAKRGRRSEAQSLVEQCFEVVREMRNDSWQVWCQEAASMVHALADQPDQAIAATQRALALAETFGLQQHVLDNAKALADLLATTRQFEAALSSQQKALQTLSQMHDELLATRVEQIDAVLDYERARAQLRTAKMGEEMQRSRNQLLLSGVLILLPLLALSIWLANSRGRAMRELHEISERNAVLARLDSLTGLPNRRALWEHLSVLDAGREGYQLLLIDLDHFKQVNDSLGHDVGDALLQHVGSVLTALISSQEMAGRWGGEEFLVVMPADDETRATEFAHRLLSALASPKPPLPATSASLGLAVRRGRKVAEVVAAADAAMYRAKQHGRAQLWVEQRSELT